MASRQKGEYGTKVVVLGASMAGLLAARVLADHFEQVILVERDKFPRPGANRKGVPQGRHTHILLERGRRIMETYLPGLTEDLTRHGATHIGDASLNVRWFHSGRYHQPGDSGISGVGVSRPVLEASVREHVLALANVHAHEECKAVGLITTADKRRVIGVRLIDQRAGRVEDTLTADLVVDASGRGSRSPAWLESLGYGPPAEEEVRIGMGYTTCYYHRRPEHIPGLDGIVHLATPPDRRLGVLLAQDHDRWVCTIGGYLGDHAPTDHQGFLGSARELPAPHIYGVINDAEPLGEPVAYTFPANLRRRYDKLARFPDGYLVFGDALCSFNPIYGQGMTVAAMESVALGACLEDGSNLLAKRFFSKASRIIDVSWNTAVGSDLSFPEVDGPRTPMVRFLNRYMGKLHLTAHDDAQVSIAFLKVINMIAPPSTVLHPRIVLRVMKRSLGLGRRGAKARTRAELPRVESVAADDRAKRVASRVL